MTVDLYEAKNIAQVVLNVINLRRHIGMGFEKSGKTVPPPKMVSIKGDDQSVSSSSSHSVAPVTIKGGEGSLKAGFQAPQQGLECHVCIKPITAAVVNACGKTWHPACFSLWHENWHRQVFRC
eukprot:TRINITY_DN3308_c0_g1_i2.p1 TRINITY_DN3308_c0_g1~~TRINITY_DN3308_c0_g1_i2.p1  ORF type:complete len:143 (+),score=18.83 TRINITY_DN3308_c0_g1_i2:62-430(+)